MIFIRFNGEEPNSDWLERAQRVTDELERASSAEERQTIIERNEGLWKELKTWLLGLSHGKCWFSEAKDLFSHFDVEHFRPKIAARNKDGSQRDGYWWLAFDYRNFRVCGNVGNRKKGTYFPLRSGHCATSENRNTDDELCYLLDPADPRDPTLLSFNELGVALPMPSCEEWERERVEESIRLFKLNGHTPLEEARREKWNNCRGTIEECKRLIHELNKAPSSKKKTEIAHRFELLREMVKPSSVLSSTAIECLRTSNIDWALRIIAGQ